MKPSHRKENVSVLRKYGSFFRLRFAMGLQYRGAALGGIATQFAWGFLNILLFDAFYRADPAAFPMGFASLTSYLWLQQAFLALFMSWFVEMELLNAISDGQIAYELARPMDLYWMWTVRSLANRLSRAALRCLPILTVALLLPKPYGLSLPSSLPVFGLFLVSCALGLAVVVALNLLLYGLNFYTVSPVGTRAIFTVIADFLAGGTIPLPFFPDGVRQAVELLPFASMQNMAFRIYSGDLAGSDALGAVGLQAFWIAVLIAAGRLLFRRATKRVVVQGG